MLRHYLQVTLNIWYPTNLTLSAADATLNSVLPVNAAPVSSSCMDTYQSTLLRLTADWSNGGVNATDQLAAADVTDLVALQSSDSNVVQVSGALAKVRCNQQGNVCSHICPFERQNSPTSWASFVPVDALHGALHTVLALCCIVCRECVLAPPPSLHPQPTPSSSHSPSAASQSA
jgi:hypothetical protein